jgi:hypothetical protein
MHFDSLNLILLQLMQNIYTLTLSDPMLNLVRQYDFPDVGRCPTRFLLCLFAHCRSLSDAFPHAVWNLANR